MGQPKHSLSSSTLQPTDDPASPSSPEHTAVRESSHSLKETHSASQQFWSVKIFESNIFEFIHFIHIFESKSVSPQPVPYDMKGKKSKALQTDHQMHTEKQFPQHIYFFSFRFFRSTSRDSSIHCPTCPALNTPQSVNVSARWCKLGSEVRLPAQCIAGLFHLSPLRHYTSIHVFKILFDGKFILLIQTAFKVNSSA